MAQYIAVRGLNRSSSIRLIDSAGDKVMLTPTSDVVVDLDLAANRRELARHSAIGQWVTSASNASVGATALTANA